MCYSNLKARWSKEMLAMFEGFVLQGLVTPLLSKVVHPNKNNIYMSQMYIIAQRGRIVATILPFFPFWDSFFSLSLQNTQWNDRKTLFCILCQIALAVCVLLCATKKKIGLQPVRPPIRNTWTRLCLSQPKICYFPDKHKRELQGAWMVTGYTATTKSGKKCKLPQQTTVAISLLHILGISFRIFEVCGTIVGVRIF